jgi:hypothetical protein
MKEKLCTKKPLPLLEFSYDHRAVLHNFRRLVLEDITCLNVCPRVEPLSYILTVIISHCKWRTWIEGANTVLWTMFVCRREELNGEMRNFVIFTLSPKWLNQ